MQSCCMARGWVVPNLSLSRIRMNTSEAGVRRALYKALFSLRID